MDTNDYRAFLAERRDELLGRVAAAAARSGRVAADVTLLAVSKTVGSEEVALAHEAGYRAFGENRPQELSRKVAAAAADPSMADVRFDLIGNLQRNKINQVLAAAPALVHSVSSAHLAEAISKRAAARGMTVDALLEVNVSGEVSKSGFAPADVLAEAESLAGLPALRIRGVMAMAPARDVDAARRTFSGLRSLREGLEVRMGLALPVMSCGMSDDFEVAVEEGSTLVRLGRIVFDPAYGTDGDGHVGEGHGPAVAGR